MDHDYIDQQLVVDRYLAGTLAPDEATSFEQHFLHCQTCLDQLEPGQELVDGLKQVVAEDASVVAGAQRAGFLVLLARLARSHQLATLAVAGLAVLVTLLPSGVLLHRVSSLDQELGSARQELASRPPDSSRQELDGLQREVEQIRESQAESQQQLEQARQAREQLSEQLDRALQPQLNLPILSLFSERSTDIGAAPTVRLRRPDTPGWIVLILELGEPQHEAYRAVILRSDRSELWRSSRLDPNRQGSLVLGLHSSMLEPANYLVRVEALPASSKPEVTAHFAFRLL